MKQLTMEYKGDELFIDGKWMGEHGNSVGPYGNSTGIFCEAKSTCPITEWADKNGVQLFWYSTLQPVSRCL